MLIYKADAEVDMNICIMFLFKIVQEDHFDASESFESIQRL